MYYWSLAWKILSITLLACEMSAIVQQFEHSLALPFFGIGMKTDFFQSYGHCCLQFVMNKRGTLFLNILKGAEKLPTPPKKKNIQKTHKQQNIGKLCLLAPFQSALANGT